MDVESVDEDDTPDLSHHTHDTNINTNTDNTHTHTNTHIDQEHMLLTALSWTSVIDTASGSTYYVNSVSGESQWDPPMWLTEVDNTTGTPTYFLQHIIIV